MTKKIVKKSVSTIMACLMLFIAVLPLSAFAITEKTYGAFTYYVNGSEITITEYPETMAGEVNIPSEIEGKPVTVIDDYAFFGCTLITKVIVPNTVRSIGNYAFAYCTYVKEIEIPSSVISIGSNAFNKSDNLTIVCPKGSYAEQYALSKGLSVNLKPVIKDGGVIGILNDYVLTVVLNGTDRYISAITLDRIQYPVKSYALPVVSLSQYDAFKGQEMYVRIKDGLVTDLLSTTKDTDHDGLYDYWEKYGLDIEMDGKIDVNLPEMGANINIPDIFVEVDWMKNKSVDFHPSNQAMKMVYDAFQNAPSSTEKINIHIDSGADSIDYVTGKKWKEYSNSSGGSSVTYYSNLSLPNYHVEGKWKSLIEKNFTVARRSVFKYCIFIYKYNGTTSSGLANGIPGQFFLVANAGWIDTDLEIAGTFMHELGHTLGLRHGGNDNTHFKPNFLSVMNYLYQTTGLISNGSKNHTLDYSRYLLPSIDENSVSETNGIDPNGLTAGTGYTAVLGNYNKGTVFNTGTVLAKNSIDFNRNNSINSQRYKYDVNGDGYSNTILTGCNDWERIVFSGGSVGDTDSDIFAASEADDNRELTKEIGEMIQSATLTCHYCSNSFDSEELFNNHILNCKEKPSKEDRCAACNKIFLNHDEFMNHIENCSEIAADISINEKLQLRYKASFVLCPEITGIKDAKASISYFSSNPDVAKVNNNGKIYASGKGTAIITCTITDEAGNQASDTCTVTVKYAWWQWIIRILLVGFLWY